jgi:bifunctional non-homologous end joining protein LigD
MVQWRSPPLARDRILPAGFIPPCQPVLSAVVPRGPEWQHELKHDGWRIIARKSGPRVRIWTRYGKEQSASFIDIAQALLLLPVTACVLDGEAVAHNADGLPDFYGLRSSAGAARAVLFAFDLLELEGKDMRGRPLVERRSILEELVFEPRDGLRLSDVFDGDGKTLLQHACAFGLEGIVSKRRSSRYRSGRSDDWRKIKCPEYQRK